MNRFAAVFAAFAFVFAAQAGAAAAGPFIVNVAYDAVDVLSGDGNCDDGTGNCTLRAAVMEANAWAGWDDIDVPGGVFQLTLGGGLDVHSGMGISGKGPRRTIVDGLDVQRVFDLRRASASISGLMIRGGREQDGAGIRAELSKLQLSWADLWVDNAAYGGGIAAYDSKLVLSGVTFVDDTAASLGGALYLAGSLPGASYAELENVTIHGNASRRGGGIFSNDVPLVLRNDTIANNSAALGGGVYALGVAPSAYNTIVAYNGGQDCANPLSSIANNEDTDATCGFFGPNDLPGVDPFLAGLAYVGGPIPTPNWVRPLLPWSPAIDRGDPATCAGVDERGQPRPVGPACDIGAYEAP
jgi:hypothetical protein